jgi:hypothetical protein
MERVTLTAAGAIYLQQHFGGNHLPSLHRNSSENNLETKTLTRQPSKGKLNAASLRSILRDDTISQVNKLKEQTNNRAYLHVKHELMKDIPASRDFLASKASTMARKMLSDDNSGNQLQTEIGKGRNYLNKLVG